MRAESLVHEKMSNSQSGLFSYPPKSLCDDDDDYDDHVDDVDNGKDDDDDEDDATSLT